MADIIEIADVDKIPKEMILLGKKTILKRDCQNQEYEVHGLLANDLEYLLDSGETMPLLEALTNLSIDNHPIKLSSGETITVQEMADGLQNIEFQITDLQAKYDALT